MTKRLDTEKFQTCNIGDAMLRNINDNFLSISFSLEDGNVQVKVILQKKTEVEENYIDDFIAELSALQSANCVNKPIIEVGDKNYPLNNVVYLRK